MEKKHLLLCCTGSVASIKIPLLIETLLKSVPQLDIKLVPTEHAQHFFDPKTLGVEVCKDEDEWTLWQKRSDPVLHIELRKWADILVIAPLDANTLAKIANGLCDNLLTCVVRAWDLKKPLLFAPAMNTFMWEHPLTAQQIGVLQGWGYKEIACIEKTLMCGDKGYGAMAEVDTIVEEIQQALEQAQSS